MILWLVINTSEHAFLGKSSGEMFSKLCAKKDQHSMQETETNTIICCWVCLKQLIVRQVCLEQVMVRQVCLEKFMVRQVCLEQFMVKQVCLNQFMVRQVCQTGLSTLHCYATKLLLCSPYHKLQAPFFKQNLFENSKAS